MYNVGVGTHVHCTYIMCVGSKAAHMGHVHVQCMYMYMYMCICMFSRLLADIHHGRMYIMCTCSSCIVCCSDGVVAGSLHQ